VSARSRSGLNDALSYRTSEEEVADRLVRQLHEDAIVTGNYLLASGHGGGEIDLLVLHPYGIVLCEIKHWFGNMVQFGVNVTFEDGYTQPNPMHGLMYKAKILRSYLMNRVQQLPFMILTRLNDAA
jgi:hypothetical protein